MTKLIQLTDLHVGLPNDDTYGVDVRANFEKVISAIESRQPQQLIVTGDLCFMQGEASVYEWIKSRLDQLSFPYWLLSGNHDDPLLMNNIFQFGDKMVNGQLFYREVLGNQVILCLDSTPGAISEQQLTWLENQLLQIQQNVLLFVHHPPMLAGVPYMDNNYPLTNADALLHVLNQFEQKVWVFSGHYHVDKMVSYRNVEAYITPSCFFQIDQSTTDFQVDHYRIGYREIMIEEELMMTNVRYLH